MRVQNATLKGVSMDRVKRARDIMIPIGEYPYISKNNTLFEAMEKFEESELATGGRKSLPRALLVFDDNNELMGIVRRRDILRGLEPDFLTSKSLDYRKKLFDVKVDPNLSELSFEALVQGVKKQSGNEVMDIIIPIYETVDHEDHLGKIIYEMVDNNVSLLPVLKDGSVVGVVRSVDVFNELYKVMRG